MNVTTRRNIVNYPLCDATWEPRENLEADGNVNEELQKWLQSSGGRVQPKV